MACSHGSRRGAEILNRYWNEQEEQATGPLTAASIWGSDPAISFGTGATDDNGCLSDGPFTGLRYDINIQLERGEEKCLTYSLKQDQFDLVSQDNVNTCNAFEGYDDFNHCLSETPHIAGHFAVGGTVRITPIL